MVTRTLSGLLVALVIWGIALAGGVFGESPAHIDVILIEVLIVFWIPFIVLTMSVAFGGTMKDADGKPMSRRSRLLPDLLFCAIYLAPQLAVFAVLVFAIRAVTD